MATLVGTQEKLVNALDALLELDYDAIEAYRAAIARVEDHGDKAQLERFLFDHERHVRVLTEMLEGMGATPSRGPDMKKWLAMGKVVIAGLVGDEAVLVAMKTNEEDTNTAYERVTARDDIDAKLRVALERNLHDEQRHKAWLEARLGLSRRAHAH